MIDVGGSSVKVLATHEREARLAPSGPDMTPRRMVTVAKRLARDWRYDVVSLGFPGPVLHGRPLCEPKNLGEGWVGFDFRRAFGKPVRIVNDAAMQALGSYQGGRMLFLGLGTGLGSALVVDGILEPMELAHLPYKKGRSFEDYVGLRGLRRLGRKRWNVAVREVVAQLRAALQADYVVVGGGNARLIERLPAHTRLGDNANAFRGGFLLWKDARRARRAHGVVSSKTWKPHAGRSRKRPRASRSSPSRS